MIIVFGIVFIVFTYLIIKSGKASRVPTCRVCNAPVFYNRTHWEHYNEFDHGHKAVPYMRIEK